MATVNVRGTATVRFSTELDVEVEDLVGDYLSDSLPGDLDVEDFEIDEVSFES